ncbi:CAAX amino terminal protease family protein [Rhynchospora pubera]|uniref:CAAX amino terminal protease family protein n=1 Tax=Rhynchospora pubera TaxID=906938 RepID=A0AAV8GWP2_9POAL|nr:CAAX amino terminal protease family protein [Rhynchospora pubera]
MLFPLSMEVKLGSNFSCIRLSTLLQGRRRAYLFASSPNSRDNFRKAFKTFASKKSERKRRKDSEVPQITPLTGKVIGSDGEEAIVNTELPSGTASGIQVKVASRSAVLQACFFTSAALLLLGVLIRQVSHLACINGLPILDATEVKFGFEIWHIELVLALVVLISSSRYILLKAWPDFAESSEAANQQVLSSLEPLDLVLVAFLPGISEEFLFRGGLMPIFGLDWKSALASGAIFGILHLSGGRKYSYTIWATIVGFAYGLATVGSSSLVVPMVSHSLNNIIGGLFWYLNSNSISEGKLK